MIIFAYLCSREMKIITKPYRKTAKRMDMTKQKIDEARKRVDEAYQMLLTEMLGLGGHKFWDVACPEHDGVYSAEALASMYLLRQSVNTLGMACIELAHNLTDALDLFSSDTDSELTL